MAVEAAFALGQSIASEVAGTLVEPTIRQFGYIFCFKSYVKELSDKKKKLTSAQDRVRNDVMDATKKDEEIQKDVQKWLADIDRVMQGLMLLENKIKDNRMRFPWCPNLLQRYKLGRKVEENTATLQKLEDESNGVKFQKVGYKAPVQSIDFLPSMDFTLSESSKEAFKQIMEALEDDTINMIGLYGMPGVGKTTLVKEVGGKSKELFDQVLMVVVSQNPDVIKVQDRVIDDLALEVKQKTKEGRASRLLNILKKVEKKVLVILDDVWDGFGLEDLNKMGIPFDDVQKERGWKILLTTRSQQVCTAMGCQRKIVLEVLSVNEAWDLFKIKANLGDEIEDFALYNMARKFAKQCKQLPLAILVVGKALRGKKTMEEWEVAFQHLKEILMVSVEANKEANYRDKNVYACLKMSYNYLESKAKLCFLLCSLFPEDHEIPIENLTRYAVGWGLYQGAKSIKATRRWMFVAIKDLKDSCLLLDTDKKDHVKMHDLVRDVAIQIASKGEHVFMVKTGMRLEEWSSYEGCTAISLLGIKLTELPDGLLCPKLKILIMGGEYGSKIAVPDKFFEGMKAIEVLSLRGGSLSLQSLDCLTNVQTVELIFCECKNLISLRKLRRLKILSLLGSSIDELPDELVGEFNELRLLDLRFCEQLERVPLNLIGRLENIEELYIGDKSFKQWGVAGTSTQRMNANLTEVNSLSQLAVLYLKVPEVESIPKDFVFPKLDIYEITIGDWSPKDYPVLRKLIFSPTNLAPLDAKIFKQLFLNACQLHLNNTMGFKNIIPEVAYGGGLEDLIFLELRHCHEIECLIDITRQQQVPATAFSNLTDLFMDSVSLQEICNGQPPNGFLQKLQTVGVVFCDHIRTLFPAKLWQALVNLVKVEICSCTNLEEIFDLDEANEVLFFHLKMLDLSCLHELRCIWKGPTRYAILQNLTHLRLWGCPKLTFIFSLSLAQSVLQLQALDISLCNELEQIIEEKGDEIISKALCFPKLTFLSVRYCDKLEYVLPISMAPSLLNLEEINIESCNQLTRVFGKVEGDADAGHEDGPLLFRQLRKLGLWYLPSLKCFVPEDFAAELPSLQLLEIVRCEELVTFLAKLQGLTNLTTLEVRGCHTLREIFPLSIFPSLLQLKFLKISSCYELEEIIARGNDEMDHQFSLESHLQTSFFPSLCKVEVKRCNNLKCLFPLTIAARLPQLQKLEIREAPRLMEIIGQDDKAAWCNVEKEIMFTNLKELCLEELPSLVYFGPRDYNFIFPHLNRLSVEKCPKLILTSSISANVSVSEKSEALTNLRELSVVECEGLKDVLQVGSFLTNRGGHHQLSLSSLETLNLSSLPELRFIWMGLLLKNLITLSVIDCNRLRHIFPPKLILSLVQLKYLKISRCEELEEIIGKNDDDDEKDEMLPESHLQSLCLPNLCKIEVERCDKLKSLFPATIAAGLPQLQYIEITEAPQLMEVFRQDDKSVCINVEEEIMVPNLKELRLEELPTLVCFSPASDDFIFARLERLTVQNCPNITALTFTTAANNSVSAKSETPKLVKDLSNNYLQPTRIDEMSTQDDVQETISSIEEEEKAIYSSYVFDKSQIKQDMPPDSAQEGGEHIGQETENSGKINQENHHNEPEGTLQNAPEETVEEISTLALTTQGMHPGKQQEIPKETVPDPEVRAESTASCKTPIIETEPGLSANTIKYLTRPPTFAEAMRIFEAAKSKRSSGRAMSSSLTTNTAHISEVTEKNFEDARKSLIEMLNMKAEDLVDAREFEKLQDLLTKVLVGKAGIPFEARADLVDITNWVKFYGRSMLDIREKKTEVAKQVQEKEKVNADLQRVLDESGLLEVEISATTSEIYALEKKIQDLQLQMQNKKEFLSAKQQDFICLSIDTVSLVEKESKFEITDPCNRLATLEVDESSQEENWCKYREDILAKLAAIKYSD